MYYNIFFYNKEASFASIWTLFLLAQNRPSCFGWSAGYLVILDIFTAQIANGLSPFPSRYLLAASIPWSHNTVRMYSSAWCLRSNSLTWIMALSNSILLIQSGIPKSLRNPSPFGMGWEKREVFRNVKALILNDLGTWRRGGNHTTTISSPVSRTDRRCL